MQISEVEVREFAYELPGVGTWRGHQVYDPDSTSEPSGFILTIRTDEGIEGNYRGFMWTKPMVTQVKMAASELLIGRDPLEREKIWQDYWTSFRHTDQIGLGAIDIALWDLAGKYHGESVSALLGGWKDRVPAYASTYWGDQTSEGLSTPKGYADFAEECLERGYTAFKIHPVGEPRKDIEICRAVADVVGGEMDLMLDSASEYRTYAEALRVGRVLDELGFFWYEDPMADVGESTYMSARLCQELDTPILGGEHVRGGPAARANHIDAEALDLVRADAHMDGGITGAMKIAHLAESFGLDVEFHVGGPAHLHCVSAIRNTNYFEHGLLHPETAWTNTQGFETDPEQFDDGDIIVPDGPGLGVDIDWAFVEDRTEEVTVIDSSGTDML